jgi:hypothetical protein
MSPKKRGAAAPSEDRDEYEASFVMTRLRNAIGGGTLAAIFMDDLVRDTR